MKKLLIFATVAILFASCDKKEVKNLTNTKDSLTKVVAEKDALINDAFLDIDEIATSLSQITVRENLVTEQTSGEITKSKKEQIAENIAAISELLDKNREALARLNSTTKKLSAANVEIGGLKKLIVSLQKQIADKNEEILAMSKKLEAMDVEIKQLTESVMGLKEDKDKLENTVIEQSNKIDDQTATINTVHYIVGSEKDLMAKNIIDKKGVIGRTGVVGKNLTDLKKHDLRNLDRIEVGKKRITIVTTHPEGSYMLVQSDNKVVEEIVITDKEKFWSSSKILIVSYK